MTLRGSARSLALALLATAAGACGDGDDAAHGVETLTLPSPEEREAARLFAQAKDLLEAGGDKAAEPILRQVLALAPRHVKALAALSRLAAERHAWTEAADLSARLVAASPGDVAARRRLVDARIGLKDLAGAETAAREWTKEVRDSSDAHFALGTVLAAAKRYEPAIVAFKQAASLKASRADVRSSLGLVYAAQGRTAEAEAAQRDAVQRDPAYADGWLRLGALLAAAGPAREPEAIDAYERGLRAEPAHAAPARADLYRLLRRAAEREPASAARADLEWKTILRVVGRDLLPFAGLGAPPAEPVTPKTETRLRAAVEAEPGAAAPRLAWAMFLHRRGDMDQAVDEYAEAVLADPAMARARAALGAALLVKGDVEKAEPQLREAVRLDPTDGVSWRNLGWALLSAGRAADAVAPLAEAVTRNPADRLAKRAHGLARLGSGDLDEGLREVAESGWRVK